MLQTKIDFLKGIGEKRADLLKKELQIYTFEDLLGFYPFRYEDRSKFFRIADINEDNDYVQLVGTIIKIEISGEGAKKRLKAILKDRSGEVELIWFQGVNWVKTQLALHQNYVVYGKPMLFGRHFNISHPDFELYEVFRANPKNIVPVYHSTTKLKNFRLNNSFFATVQENLWQQIQPFVSENLPVWIIEKYKLVSRAEALRNIHFPENFEVLEKTLFRLKFEELFFMQISLLRKKGVQKNTFSGQILRKTELLTDFYKNHLPFDLTDAQKRVIKEIYKDLCSGKQMNRLLQGDVGSGKTIVAFICMLIAIDNGSQACLMAPTEILAEQHFEGLKVFAEKLGLNVQKLTGSSKTSQRKYMYEALQKGEIQIIVGTHALLEDKVEFNNLGLCVIDEQHRFGVAQRAKLWQKQSKNGYPHILVMTATPIPRTLAMTVYGDLDTSIIDELPKGRKPIQTLHQYDSNRLKVFGFMKKEIELGRQIYVVYPLIEESETLDYKNLMDGFESISRAFPDIPLSIVHGKMKPQDKDFEMQRFIKNETKIMVATTVIEVGVNVPNASVMVIENAEKFGLSQLHQLRGRVGRGAEQSYCILMSSFKLSKDARTRIQTMVETNNGFEIAEIDLKLRGPGDLAGTQQSGVLNLKLVNLAKDQELLKIVRNVAVELMSQDIFLQKPEHQALKQYLENNYVKNNEWAKIS